MPPAGAGLSFTGVNDAADLLSRLARLGIAVAELAYRHGLSASAGLDAATTRSYTAIGRSLFGPCSEPKVRAQVLEHAAEFPITRLQVIHKAARQLHRDANITRWQLWLELAQRHELSIDQLREYARNRVRELNRKTGTTPARSLIIGRDIDATGRRTALLKLPAAEMALLEKKIRRMTAKRGTVPEDIAMGNAIWTLLKGTAHTSRGEEKTPEPTFLVKAEDLVGNGNGELVATDGTIIDAQSYLNSQLGRFGWAMIYDKNAQPVNLHRLKRFANDKQRTMLAIDQGECAWPGCRRKAIYAKAHHINAWQHGGATNLNNLVALCGPHNARNDDNPNSPPRNGRIGKDPDGHPCWHPPDGGPPQYNDGIHTQKSGRVWAQQS